MSASRRAWEMLDQVKPSICAPRSRKTSIHFDITMQLHFEALAGTAEETGRDCRANSTKSRHRIVSRLSRRRDAMQRVFFFIICIRFWRDGMERNRRRAFMRNNRARMPLICRHLNHLRSVKNPLQINIDLLLKMSIP